MAKVLFRRFVRLLPGWLPILAVFAGFIGKPGGSAPPVSSVLQLSPPSAEVTGQGSSNPATVISDSEELVYEASWWAFKLGQIRVVTTASKGADGSLHPTATAYIDSYGNLPFVDVHSISSTEMDSTLLSRSSKSIEKRNEEWWVLRHHFNPETHTLIIEDSWQKTRESEPYKPPESDTLTVNGKLQDGLSILFFARANLHSLKTFHVPTIVYKKLGRTTLEFTGETKGLEIDDYDGSIAVKGVRGTAEFQGIFGFSGDFEGWFTDDAAAVPVKAKLGVIIGSIEIQLKKWKRAGWSPPLER